MHSMRHTHKHAAAPPGALQDLLLSVRLIHRKRRNLQRHRHRRTGEPGDRPFYRLAQPQPRARPHQASRGKRRIRPHPPLPVLTAAQLQALQPRIDHHHRPQLLTTAASQRKQHHPGDKTHELTRAARDDHRVTPPRHPAPLMVQRRQREHQHVINAQRRRIIPQEPAAALAIRRPQARPQVRQPILTQPLPDVLIDHHFGNCHPISPSLKGQPGSGRHRPPRHC